jgi:hypothetical protein
MEDESCRLRVRCKGCGGTFVSAIIFQPDQVVQLCETCEHCMTLNRLSPQKFSELKLNEPPESKPPKLNYPKCKPAHEFNQATLVFLTRTPELYDVAIAFANNVTKMGALSELPVAIAWLSRLFQRAEDAALKVAPREDRAAHEKAFSAAWTNWFADNRGVPRIEHVEVEGEGTLEALTGTYIRSGLEAVLLAQITGMWTAIETLLGDLWEAALNAHPSTLSNLNGYVPESERKMIAALAAEDPEDDEEIEAEHVFLSKHLLANKFDLSR